MSNNELTIISEMADKATTVLKKTNVWKHGKPAPIPAIILSVQDRVNEEPSFHFLTMAQAAEVGAWLIEQSA